ncbi:PREDICTED: L-threonine dehydratase catabolic TdcB-like [Acropora digitifera]|uniref:L-threonine dehydratase catabolic TdcB-like n=1 Tax=Acropora digitifera TaxID=70779 RepID=UPI00077AB870|nr:PREDICTED: L-threonine dehydratase catabolic TdcB-like [Acropora digitifera]
MYSPEDILRASDRIKPHIRRTPLEYSHWLSEEGNSKVYVKLESEQITGSFKVRGAFNKLLSLKESKDEVFLTKGVITASSGNHGAATVCLMVFLLSKYSIELMMFQGGILCSIFTGHA